MKKILAGMHPGVCTAAAIDRSGRFQDLQQSGFQHFLYGQCIGLPLPAVIVEPVVGDMEEVALDVFEGKGSVALWSRACIFI